MVVDVSDTAAVLVGMDGFVVRAAIEADGEVWLAVETTATTAVCAGCGARARAKGRRKTMVRDLPAAGRPVVLVWNKRRWSCPDADCDTKTWSEQSVHVSGRASLSERARVECCRLVGQEARSVAEVARTFGVSWQTVWAAVVEYGRPLVDDPDRTVEVAELGIDETGWLKATARHRRLWATGLVDTAAGRLVDVIVGRDIASLRDWLAGRTAEWLAAVRTVSIDPFDAYRTGLSPHLAHVTVVADPFHVVRLANTAVDQVRRRTQNAQTGHRGRRGDPLYDIRKLLLTGQDRLSGPAWTRLQDALGRGDPRDEVLAAWLAKEHVREVYATPHPTLANFLLGRVIRECAASGIKELATLANTLGRWRTEIINHHRTGASNGPTEAMNLLIKNVKRVGRGFTNFEHYRLRLLLHCGVECDHHRTASIRGRTPHLAA